jgi:hypothetical protein
LEIREVSSELLRALIFPIAAVLLVSNTAPASATASPWKEHSEGGVLEHVPSGLRFPPKIGELARQPLTSGENPYTPGAASVSYGSPEAAGVLVTLIPVSGEPPVSAEKLFSARALLFREQHPGAKTTDPSRIAARCDGTGHAWIAAFELDSRREWFYTTVARNFVVYVRASEPLANAENRFALGDLVATMRWPCPGHQAAARLPIGAVL